MSKNRKSSEKNKQVSTDVSVQGQAVTSVGVQDPATTITPLDFDAALSEAQKRRHENIGYLFDKAASLLESILDDPNVEAPAKMFPVKLAMDIYNNKEKFAREDERIDIEKRKLYIEEKKAGMVQSLPAGSTFNQQNNFISIPTSSESSKNFIDLNSLKKKQEEILSSFLQKKPDKEI